MSPRRSPPHDRPRGKHRSQRPGSAELLATQSRAARRLPDGDQRVIHGLRQRRTTTPHPVRNAAARVSTRLAKTTKHFYGSRVRESDWITGTLVRTTKQFIHMKSFRRLAWTRYRPSTPRKLDRQRGQDEDVAVEE